LHHFCRSLRRPRGSRGRMLFQRSTSSCRYKPRGCLGPWLSASPGARPQRDGRGAIRSGASGSRSGPAPSSGQEDPNFRYRPERNPIPISSVRAGAGCRTSTRTASLRAFVLARCCGRLLDHGVEHLGYCLTIAEATGKRAPCRTTAVAPSTSATNCCRAASFLLAIRSRSSGGGRRPGSGHRSRRDSASGRGETRERDTCQMYRCKR
jgi:hypothetical protein